MSAYKFNSLVRNNYLEIEKTLNVLYKTEKPVILCIGTDLIVGDCFGPMVGSYIKNKLNGKAYVYGTLNNPLTAKEAVTLSKTIKLLHPNSKILVVDAAIGSEDEVGNIKVKSGGVKPGLGYDKNLPLLGDVSIVGVVSKSKELCVRLGLIYNLAKDASEGIIRAIL